METLHPDGRHGVALPVKCGDGDGWARPCRDRTRQGVLIPPDAVLRGGASGHERHPGWDANRRRGVGVGELHAGGAQPVEVRGPDLQPLQCCQSCRPPRFSSTVRHLAREEETRGGACRGGARVNLDGDCSAAVTDGNSGMASVPAGRRRSRGELCCAGRSSAPARWCGGRHRVLPSMAGNNRASTRPRSAVEPGSDHQITFSLVPRLR